MSQLKKPTIKNPDLVAAMAEFKKQQSVQTEKEMLDAIAAASFIAPITLQNKLNEVEPDENGQRHMEASLMAVSNKDGVKFFPAFTAWLEFLKWKNDPDADTMVITFDQYCGILLKQGVDVSGIVINPAETNIVIRKEKMAEMKGVSPEAEQPQEAPKKNNILPLFGCEKVTNPEVIVAADRLRRENNEPARNNMFEAMRKARFVAPVLMEVPKEVKAGEKVNAQAEFIMLNHEGGKYMPLFTSLSELQKWNGAPDCKAVPMSMANYVAMLSDPKSTAAGIVLDPFLGSGSTLIACEETDRVCRGIELDPKFVDVIVKRYIEHSEGHYDDVYVIRDSQKLKFEEVATFEPEREVADGE